MKNFNVKNITIAGINYKITYTKSQARDRGELGAVCGNSSEINIDESLDTERQKKTLIHEIIEAFNFEYELNLEHKQISILETAFFTVLKDNQELFSKIIGDK